jgi:hypothetical protein
VPGNRVSFFIAPYEEERGNRQDICRWVYVPGRLARPSDLSEGLMKAISMEDWVCVFRKQRIGDVSFEDTRLGILPPG